MQDLRIESVKRGRQLTIFVNGKKTVAYEGETVHAALVAAGFTVLRKSKAGMVRGAYCGMGTCYDCLVEINGLPNCRACMNEVEAGMKIEIDET
jgi:D-hydroxyproline dehydrogenase subunit gamma